jgi:SAM-dependent methyltransferase
LHFDLGGFIDMNSTEERWVRQYTDTQSSVEWWDSMAADFSKHDLPTSDNSLAIRIIEQERIPLDNARVLDVGCGSGRFSVALGRRGATVMGTDLSPKMIGFAQKAAEGLDRVTFSNDDWYTLDLKEKGWEKSFGLVLANMTPAIADAGTFMKLSAASIGWCIFVKPSRRVNSLLDPLHELIGAPRDTKGLDDTIAYAFERLWRDGLSPKIDYAPEVWHNRKPLEEAVHQYTKRIESYMALDNAQRDRIKRHLTNQADKDGFVEETTTTTIVAMYWHV